MGRLLDFVFVLIAIMMFLILQFVGGAVLDPMRDELIEEGIDDSYNADESFADMITAVTKWAPLTGLLGTIVLVAYREYRRQQISAATGGVRP